MTRAKVNTQENVFVLQGESKGLVTQKKSFKLTLKSFCFLN